MNYIFNGLLVQSRRYSESTLNADYQGVAAWSSWPLSDTEVTSSDPVAARLTSVLDDAFLRFVDGDYAPHLVPDMSVAEEYANHCISLNINVRVLMCATTARWPQMDHNTIKSTKGEFLGYDYAAASCDLSLIAEDLTEPQIQGLETHRAKLNRFGLFANQADLDDYIIARHNMIESEAPLEGTKGIYGFCLYLAQMPKSQSFTLS